MGFLDTFGLSRKKKGASPISFDKKKHPDHKFLQFLKENGFKLVISLVFLGITATIFPRTTVQDFAFKMGEPWRDEDVVAPFTFSLLKEREEIAREEENIRKFTPPIFHVDHRADIRIQNRLDSLFRNIQPVVDAYAKWRVSDALEKETIREDSLRFIAARNQSGVGLDENGWRALLSHYAELRVAQETGQRIANPRFIGVDIRLRLENLIEQILRDGIINVPKQQLQTEEITVRNVRDRTERSFAVTNVREGREARDYARIQLSRSFEEDAALTGMQLFNLVIEPNFLYRENETRVRIAEAISEISPTKGAIAAGQVIIRRGDIVTQERYNMLQSMAVARTDRKTDLDRWQMITGETIIIIAVFLTFFMYLYLYRRSIYNSNSMFLLVFLIMTLLLVSASLIIRVEGASMYLAPVAIAPIILTIIFDSRVGLMVTLTIALLTGMMYGNNFEFILATVVACSMGVYSVRDIKNRSQFYLFTPALVFGSYVLVLFGFTLTKLGGWDVLLENGMYLIGNAVGIWLTYPLILLIEKTFKVTTDVTLLELSDTNQPILKRMMTEAPGSFHHSLQVANMTEAAASAIGANPLLARVGALYHDIGKLQKPSYFIENQHGRNDHEDLKPRMSALIIKEHVTAGVKMAKELELPEDIVNFIRTHHGTSLIEFFYKNAKQKSKNEQEIQEEDFRYDGPIPNTKETGILLLADGIEAASRTLDDRSYTKLEGLIDRMVDKRMEEGQLNDCALTFRDISIIKQSFLSILGGVYHVRVKYPDQEE